MLTKRLLAEGVGTFMLVFVGTGAVALASVTNAYAGFGIALAFGVVVWLMVGLFGPLSGAHINPAVTLGFRFCGAIESRLAWQYLVVQCIGALAASLLLLWLAPPNTNLGATTFQHSWLQAFIVELLLTAGLMWVILLIVNYPVKNSWLAGLGIGGWVFAAAWLAGPLTGASMNPARSLGPAVATMQFQSLWLYVCAPVLGAAVGLFFCRISGTGRDCCRSRLATD